MTLWTPDGERPVGGSDPAEPQLTPEQEAQAREMAQQMTEARQQLLETEVATVVANHALGLYELAAIHITAEDPDLAEARLAVDAMATLVEGLRGRLGDVEANLEEALHQIKLAFVQRVQAQQQSQAGQQSQEQQDGQAEQETASDDEDSAASED